MLVFVSLLLHILTHFVDSLALQTLLVSANLDVFGIALLFIQQVSLGLVSSNLLYVLRVSLVFLQNLWILFEPYPKAFPFSFQIFYQSLLKTSFSFCAFFHLVQNL